MKLLLIAGIGVILAGLAAIGFGIPVKEFGFGNTLILTGTVGACTGLIMVSMALAVEELKKFRPQGEIEEPATSPRLPRRELNLPTAQSDDAEEADDASVPGPLFSRDQPAARPAAPEPGVPPWQDEVLRDRERLAATEAPEPEEPKRRNLLFQSSRRERERAEAAAAFEAAMPKPEAPAEPSKNFEDAWPQPDRSRSDAIRRAARTPSSPGDKLPDAALIPDRYVPPTPAEEPPQASGVTVLKSGVVDGMAYSLYSDGSIEAQMPEGMMRFASIDELREHLDNRG
ncbi:hypothetical protein [Tardiphaga sp. P9-11]|jgi:hypothetical protein|uniref:hypothetical protein n=1 Tax=Tardiphaga sp. P9-11 TaxID=2024614 RepID=UPI0011F32AE5|nr:hypothetical protein [Tardiphaga sp. P9-11]KAA0076374.1 hypothetical protein CIW50_09095 [Tardiphaga sp. P9-11]